MSTTKFNEGKWVLLFCLFSHRLSPRSINLVQKLFFTSVGCEAATLEVVMIITMSFILGVQKHVAEQIKA